MGSFRQAPVRGEAAAEDSGRPDLQTTTCSVAEAEVGVEAWDEVAGEASHPPPWARVFRSGTSWSRAPTLATTP